MDGKKRAILILLTFLYPLINGFSQDCNILSKGNNILPDKLCAPVFVTWDVNYTGVNHGGTLVEFEFDWDDGSAVERIAASSPSAGVWEANNTHVYPIGGDQCVYRPKVLLVVNGVTCTSSVQEQVVTVWDTDQLNGGELAIDPPVFPICVGSDGSVIFKDVSEWNCTPPEENDNPNDYKRWIQWVYGTNDGAGNFIDDAEVGGAIRTYPYAGSVDVTFEPILAPTSPWDTALEIYVPDTRSVGDEFEVTLRNWNYCNPYDQGYAPEEITAIILIVDVPDGTINPAGPYCENEEPVFLSAVTPGGRWTGSGIIGEFTGEFSPTIAGAGTHTVYYEVSDGNNCSAIGQLDIVVRDAPVADITIGSPALLCPGVTLSLDGNPSFGVTPYTHLWTGDVAFLDDVNSQTPDFTSTIEDSYELVYRVTDNNFCFDEDTIVVIVDSVEINFANKHIELCTDVSEQLKPDPYGGSGVFVQHLWTGDRVDLLSDVNVEQPIFNSSVPGIYKFQYYVKDSQDCDDSDSITVEVFEQPVSDAGPDNKACGLQYDMQAVASAGVGTWQLKVGVGAVSFVDINDPNTQIVVDAYGDYTFIWDEDNNTCVSSDEVTIRFVQVPAPNVVPVADTCGLSHKIEAIPDIGVGLWKQVEGSGSSVFDDALASTTNVSVDVPGLYRFAWVEENDGCFAGDSLYINFYPEVIADVAPFDNEGCGPFEVEFENLSVNADSYIWDFGDGYVSNQVEPVHIFNNPLAIPVDYKVKLLAMSNDGCRDSVFYDVRVNPSTLADFTNDPTPGCSPLEVDFLNESSGATLYEWDFGDGSPVDNNEDVSHVFVNAEDFVQSYKVQLAVDNAYGCKDTATTFVTVYPLLSYDFTVEPQEGCHPLKVDFVAKPGAYSYEWNFGEGTVISGTNAITHVFENTSAGVIDFEVTLSTNSAFGCKDVSKGNVRVKPSPQSSFTYSPTEGCTPLPVDFNNESLGAVTSLWIFGDGESESVVGAGSVSHEYVNDEFAIQSNKVKLIVENEFGCKDSTESLVRVYPRVEAVISDGGAGCSPYLENFTNESEGATKFYWDFGDGNTSTAFNGQNEYVNTDIVNKVFDVELLAESSYGCIDKAYTTVEVYRVPNVVFDVNPKVLQMPESTIEFENSTLGDDWSYKWDFGDGNGSAERLPEPYTYTNSGQFEVTLEVFDANCADSDKQFIEVIAMLPDIDYGPDGEGCPPLLVQFYNNTIDATTYFWDFGDGNVSADKEPEHTYYTPGEYAVKLIAEGPGGVSESSDVKVKVFNKPVANFEVRPNRVKLPQTVSFINKSEGATSYLWDFGDGNTSTEHSLQYGYEQAGVYDVVLEVTNDEGCVDELMIRGAVTAEEAGTISFPNAFTPNPNGSNGGEYTPGERENYVFYPFVQEGIVEYDLKIFSRWGELLYESKDVNIGWDGYHRGKLCTQGVYIWKVVCKYSNGTIETKTGDVTLFR
ncbi:PKD domain-containing protein [Carboxylicivirga sp. N1Y90]|uniref:PKD domain-containing protein n=1 Tax=Carboxylicivirga fragile TaxID=3417571 RepID=UPI003D359347|nr:PKD domain-containing protein [Marinilabiliaceae bacterium N1Y90]